MKNHNSLSRLIATSSAIGASVSVTAAFVTPLPGVTMMAVAASLGMIGMAISEYSRRSAPLAIPATIHRPELPASVFSRAPAGSFRRRSALVERVVA
ncbi:MAG: hypothetical protein ACHQ5A_02645 [Opitutales bacterium]